MPYNSWHQLAEISYTPHRESVEHAPASRENSPFYGRVCPQLWHARAEEKCITTSFLLLFKKLECSNYRVYKQEVQLVCRRRRIGAMHMLIIHVTRTGAAKHIWASLALTNTNVDSLANVLQGSGGRPPSVRAYGKKPILPCTPHSFPFTFFVTPSSLSVA
jgi:hypothetical protein